MIRLALTAAITLAAAPALAHPGHLLGQGHGHEHVSGLALLGAAAVVAGLLWLYNAARARRA